MSRLMGTDLEEGGPSFGRISSIFRDLRSGTGPVRAFEAAQDLEEAGVSEAVAATTALVRQCENEYKPTNLLTPDDEATLKLYTAEDETQPPIYKDVNENCYSTDRKSTLVLRRKFMWNMLQAMKKIPPYDKPVVHRGVKKNLVQAHPEKYQIGKIVTWWGFASTTKTPNVLQNDMFLGKTGPRTIFCITLTQGAARDISPYSLIPEGEVLLPPGSTLAITDIADLGGDLTMICVEEREPIDEILTLRENILQDKALAGKGASDKVAANKLAADKAAADKAAADKAAADTAAAERASSRKDWKVGTRKVFMAGRPNDLSRSYWCEATRMDKTIMKVFIKNRGTGVNWGFYVPIMIDNEEKIFCDCGNYYSGGQTYNQFGDNPGNGFTGWMVADFAGFIKPTESEPNWSIRISMYNGPLSFDSRWYSCPEDVDVVARV